MAALESGQTSASMQPHFLILLRSKFPRRIRRLMVNHPPYRGSTTRKHLGLGSFSTAPHAPRSSPTQQKNRTVGLLKHTSGSPFPATNSARFVSRRYPLTSGKPGVRRNAETRGREFSAKVEFCRDMTQKCCTTHDGGAARDHQSIPESVVMPQCGYRLNKIDQAQTKQGPEVRPCCV